MRALDARFDIRHVFDQAASVIQKHWVEGESATDVDDDQAGRNQVQRSVRGALSRDTVGIDEWRF